MRKWFPENKQLLKDILWSPGVRLMCLVYGLITFISTYIVWLIPSKDQPKTEYIQLLTWQIWIIVAPILTVILIALIVRSALKVIAKRDAEHLQDTTQLQAELGSKVQELETLKTKLPEPKPSTLTDTSADKGNKVEVNPIFNISPTFTKYQQQSQEQLQKQMQLQKEALSTARIEILKLTSKMIDVNDLPTKVLAVPFRNNSGIAIRNIAAQIKFDNTATSLSRDVSYGFWLEPDGKRISLSDGDTGHIAIVGVLGSGWGTLDNKWTRRHIGEYCEMKSIQNGIWRVEINLVGDSFRQSFPQFDIEISGREVRRLSEPE